MSCTRAFTTPSSSVTHFTRPATSYTPPPRSPRQSSLRTRTVRLSVYRNYRHCNARRHRRLASPTYRYRPHIATCASKSSVAVVSSDENCEDQQRPSATSTAKPRELSVPSPPASPPPQPPQLYDRGLHNHLLLVTGQVYHEYIAECSVMTQARDLQDLGSMLRRTTASAGPGDFVLIQVGTGWRLNVRLLDVLVERLGNVTVYADKKYYSKTMAKHCWNIGAGCTLLTSLMPVLEQFESGAVSQPKNVDESAGGATMYDPEWIPVPALPPLPRDFNGSTAKQIEYLTWRLCVRDRRHNLYYKLDKDSPTSVLRLASHTIMLRPSNQYPLCTLSPSSAYCTLRLHCDHRRRPAIFRPTVFGHSQYLPKTINCFII